MHNKDGESTDDSGSSMYDPADSEVRQSMTGGA